MLTLAPRKAIALVAAMATAGAVLLAPSAASAAKVDPATHGLFGSQDPTYDGVYRQSVSLILLEAADARVPGPAVRWLKRQQCRNGSFTSYRADLDERCGFFDTNATALATIALRRIGERAAARAAAQWLIRQQKPSGGWMFSNQFPGPADANSTGLVIQALLAMRIDPRDVARRQNGLQFLESLQLDCASEVAADRGALDYQKQTPLAANTFATAQATAALAQVSLPVRPRPADATRPAFTCDGSPQPTAADAAAGYVGRQIRANGGSLPGWDGSPDYGSTANAVLSLVATGRAANQIARATDTLETAAATYTRDGSGSVVPAASAMLGLTAVATGRDPRSFGDVNTIRSILSSRTRVS